MVGKIVFFFSLDYIIMFIVIILTVATVFFNNHDDNMASETSFGSHSFYHSSYIVTVALKQRSKRPFLRNGIV